MNTSASSEAPAVAAPKTLTRFQLTAALILVTLLPFSLVVVLYYTMPDHEDPVLQVMAEVGPRAWPDDTAPDARIVPSLILRNPTDEAWNNLNLSINEQFHYYHPEVLRPNAEFFVPLKFFHTKGNVFFSPDSQSLELLTVYAQIPSGARAIAEIDGDTLGFRPP